MRKITLMAIMSGLLFAGTIEDNLNEMGAIENARIATENARMAKIEANSGKITVSAKSGLTRGEFADTYKDSDVYKLNKMGEKANSRITADNNRAKAFNAKYGKFEVEPKTSISRTEMENKD